MARHRQKVTSKSLLGSTRRQRRRFPTLFTQSMKFIVPWVWMLLASVSLSAGPLAGEKLLVTSVRTGDTEVFVSDPETGDMTNLSRSPNIESLRYQMAIDGSRAAWKPKTP